MTQVQAIQPTKLVLVGFAAGVIGGGLGLGGGFIMVPVLVALGYDRHRAHATSLAAMIMIGLAGALAFGAAGEIDVWVGVKVGLGGIAGSVLGATTMNRVSARTLKLVFLVMVLLVSVRMLAGPITSLELGDSGGLAAVLISVSIGMGAGFLAGMAGVGGGMIIVPAAVLLLGLSQHEAQGTSLVAIIFTAVSATVVNSRNGRIRLKDGLFLGLAGAAGALVGIRVALGLDGPTLSRVFGVVLFLVALRLIYQEVHTPGNKIGKG